MIKKDSFAEYRKAEGINASLLKAATSPRAVQKYLERDSKPSDQMILGTLFHNLLLEPNAHVLDLVVGILKLRTEL